MRKFDNKMGGGVVVVVGIKSFLHFASNWAPRIEP